MLYNYELTLTAGQVTGQIEAEDDDQAIEQLRETHGKGKILNEKEGNEIDNKITDIKLSEVKEIKPPEPEPEAEPEESERA